MKPVYLKWRDSTSWTGWQNMPLTDVKLSEIETVGYIIHETKKKIIIAHSISDQNHCEGIIGIPKKVITERRNLK